MTMPFKSHTHLVLLQTRSLDKEVKGISDLEVEHEARIRNGMIAYDLLEKLRAGDKSDANLTAFDEVKGDLGYGLLLKRYTDDIAQASEEQFAKSGKRFYSASLAAILVIPYDGCRWCHYVRCVCIRIYSNMSSTYREKPFLT